MMSSATRTLRFSPVTIRWFTVFSFLFLSIQQQQISAVYGRSIPTTTTTSITKTAAATTSFRNSASTSTTASNNNKTNKMGFLNRLKDKKNKKNEDDNTENENENENENESEQENENDNDNEKTNENEKSNDNKEELEFLNDLRDKYEHQPTFLQAVEEMATSLLPLLQDKDKGAFYQRAFLTLTEPERTISFRVPWMDDNGQLHINRGWRVEFSSALGPYKGGLRFHPTANEDVLKFLGFEQMFKNALTGLPMGGGKGGSDFDPKQKSDGEVRRFCESFMNEMFRYLHPSTDVPAGDMGVGSREIGYLYGQYKRLTNRHGEGVLTGKSPLFGGSALRPEATGYGLVYMAQLAMQKKLEQGLEGLRCAVSGSGNVAQYACEKLIELGAKVITVSDSNGVLVFDDGMTRDDWNAIIECKNEQRGRLSSLKDKVTGKFVEKQSPWTLDIAFDLALPCATQNEIDDKAARLLVKKGVKAVLEGANLPTTIEAQEVLRQHNIMYIPGKASNAGGVGVSGLEMSQNAQRLVWSREEVDQKLQDMMANIYQQMEEHGDTFEEGANRAGFIKVANAMKELGWIY